MSPDDVTAGRIADFLFEAGHLSAIRRAGFALLGTSPQNVAEHSFRTAVIGYVLAALVPGAQAERVMLMGLLHDLAETRTGDLHSLNKRYTHRDESAARRDQFAGLPMSTVLEEIAREYEAGASLESRLAHDADHLELLLTLREQHRRGDARAADWFARTRDRVQTPEGQSIAEAILSRDPAHWWQPSTDAELPPAGDD